MMEIVTNETAFRSPPLFLIVRVRVDLNHIGVPIRVALERRQHFRSRDVRESTFTEIDVAAP